VLNNLQKKIEVANSVENGVASGMMKNGAAL
jgi:hypothetical protein